MTRKQPIAEGGWSIFGSMWGGYDWYSPAGDPALRGNGMNSWFGWPVAPKLEALREQWLRAPDLATQKALARDRKSTRLNSSHSRRSRMPSSA